MAFPRVLFAGDSNLKFATKFIPTGYAECLKVMSVPGASIVDDTKDFEKLLLKMLKSFMPGQRSCSYIWGQMMRTEGRRHGELIGTVPVYNLIWCICLFNSLK